MKVEADSGAWVRERVVRREVRRREIRWWKGLEME